MDTLQTLGKGFIGADELDILLVLLIVETGSGKPHLVVTFQLVAR
jgi:hypothetical protein